MSRFVSNTVHVIAELIPDPVILFCLLRCNQIHLALTRYLDRPEGWMDYATLDHYLPLKVHHSVILDRAIMELRQ